MIESNVTEKTTVQPPWFTILRVALGLILFWKGIVYIRDTSRLELLMQHTGLALFSNNSSVLSFIISYLGLLCGLFILSGLFTRISCIIQIPILFVAVFFVNIKGAGQSSFELILSIIVLILLILFAIKGSGTLSGDEFFRTYYKAGTEDGNTQRFFKN
ncbi:MAG: DoxX family protein [Bacteroidota bacterium]|nr:DoxX family protein [Bacteroidota bacterium]